MNELRFLRTLFKLFFRSSPRRRYQRSSSIPRYKSDRKRIAGRCWVVDADGVKVQDVNIRLSDLDAPEHRQLALRKNGQWYDQGKFVKWRLISEVGGKYVHVDVEGRDKFDRAIGILWHNGKDVNEWLVRNGYAIAAYGDRYYSAEREAKRKKSGIWSDTVSYCPKAWRHGRRKKLMA